MISLYESIFSIGDPSAAKKAVDATRIEDLKKNFLPHISGESLIGTKTTGGGLDKNLTITDDCILNISNLRRPKDNYVALHLDNHSKAILDKNDIVGINFIPSRKGSFTSSSRLDLYVPENIDLKTSRGPFEIINSKYMFSEYEIRGNYNYTPSHINNIGCIKNLKISSTTLSNSTTQVDRINVYDHMFENCDLGQCTTINFVTTWNNVHPTALLKNSKLTVTKQVDILIRELDDAKIFQEWKDFIFDGSVLKKDLLKRLGFDNNSKFNKFSLRIFYVSHQGRELIQILTDGQSPSPSYKKTGEYNISGISGKVSVYVLKR